MRLWSLNDVFAPPSAFAVPGQTLGSLAASPDGTLIATDDVTALTKGKRTPDLAAIRLWYIDPVKVARDICRTLRVPVTRATWDKYGLGQYPYTPICA